MTRSLCFPRDRSVGWVKIPCAGADPNDNWHEIGDARGRVFVPDDQPVRLIVEPNAARDLEWLDALAPDALIQLYLVQTRVTDAQLRHVGRLTGLEELTLSHPFAYGDITDGGVAQLRSLRRLRRLYLTATNVSDDGLCQLRDFVCLERLSLGATLVTDAGLHRLFELQNLRVISFDSSYAGRRSLVTHAGIQALQSALPGCRIESA